MAEIHFYNTLTNRLERFEPIEPPHVSLYSCGPTVYDHAHVGNFKTFLFADVLRRFLELVGHDVHHVMNLTDVGHMTDDEVADGAGEDKMAAAAKRVKEAKKSGDAHLDAIQDPDDPFQIADFYSQQFIADAQALQIKVASEPTDHLPRATGRIDQIQAMIQTLLDNKHAYVASDGVVYYSVESFPAYGRLSGNVLDKLVTGAGGRVQDEHQAAKRHPGDFFLWKPDPSHIMKWDSPWGTGYPGWHIECSVLATSTLGRDLIDIHTGGEDLIFPHHECEIAQTCGATGRDHFARFWMHSRHLMIEGQKMSKSLGNFYTVPQVLEGEFTGRPVDPAALRFELIKANYRSRMNMTRQGLEDSARNVRRLREAADRCGPDAAAVDLDHPVLSRFVAALADDLNMAAALAVVFEFLGDAAHDAESAGVLRRMDSVLGVLTSQAAGEDDEEVRTQCAAIDAARAAKDYETADRIRAQLIEAGYDVKTGADGTVAVKKLA